MAENRLVGGLQCFEVLEVLSDYLDGDLEVGTRSKVDAHLSGCDTCTKFGGEFGAVLRALRQQVKSAEEPVRGASLEKLGL